MIRAGSTLRKSDTTALAGWKDTTFPIWRAALKFGADDHVVNLDIFHPDYHSRYLRLVAAIGKSGKLNRKEIGLCYIHMVSTTHGEENDGNSPGNGDMPRWWSVSELGPRHLQPDRYKLMFTGHHPENLKICYDLGIGQRNGYIERYLLYTQDPASDRVSTRTATW